MLEKQIMEILKSGWDKLKRRKSQYRNNCQKMLLQNLFQPIMALFKASTYSWQHCMMGKNTLDDTQLHTRKQMGPKDEHLALF